MIKADQWAMAVLDNATGGVMLMDPGMIITYCNPAALKALRLEGQEPEGRQLLELFPEAKGSRLEEEIRRAFKERSAGAVELLLGGEQHGQWYDVQLDPLGDQLAMWIKITTERRAREATLEANEQMFRELAELLPAILFEVDLEGKITYANQHAYRSLGYTAEELLADLDAYHFVDPEDHLRVAENIQRILKGEEIGTREYTLRKKDGTPVPCVSDSRAITRGDEVVGLRGFLVDISRWKAAEQSLRRREARYQEFLELLPEVVFETDLQGRLTYSNSAGFELTGFSKEDLDLGLQAIQMVAAEDRERAGANFMRAMLDELRGSRKYLGLKKDGGTYPCLISSTPIYQQGAVVGVRGIIMDLSHHKEPLA